MNEDSTRGMPSSGQEPSVASNERTSGAHPIGHNLWTRRQALQLFGGTVAGVTLGLNLRSPAALAATVNPIIVENQQTGTTSWQRRTGYSWSDDTTRQIQGYASSPSVNKGQQINLHITTNPAQPYTIDVYRMGWYSGLGGRLMKSVGPLDGVSQPAPALDPATGLIDCNWSVGYTLDVPETWTSGVYLAVLTNQQKYQSYIIFVVRDDARVADILYQQPVTTYQAYNNYPNDSKTGKSLYDFNSYGSNTTATGSTRAAKVTFDRPYSDGHGAGQFVYSWDWETYFIRWAERNGYDVAYSTNLDTHTNGGRLLNYKGFVSVGHDEYWSKQMYDAAQTARDSGVNLGFFGSNGLHWQIRFESSTRGASDRVMVCYKKALLDPVDGPTTTVKWRDPVLNRPEQGFMGVQYTSVLQNNGQGAKFVVNNTGHWVYEGTGFADGDQVPGIVGYETDRLMSEYPKPKNTEYTILSHSPVTNTQGAGDYTDSSIYKATSGAWVYSTGTNHWAYGLDQSGVTDTRIQQTTSNILNAFASSTAPTGEVAPSAPSDLVAAEMSSSRIDLRWTDNATNETSYTVERSPDGTANWTVLTTSLAADSTGYSDTGLSPNTTYYYRIKATNGTNESDYSNVASDTTEGDTAVVFSDDFTGPDGAGWDATKWATNVGTSALADIQSNQGRMRYENVANARALATARGGKSADAEALVSFRFPSTSPRGFFYVFLRGSGDWVGTWPSNSYFLQFQNDSGQVNVWKSTPGGATTQIATQKIGQVTTAKQWVRFKVQGTNLKAKVWTDGTPEPATWEMAISDSALASAGFLQLKWLRGGVATSAGEVLVDDVQVTTYQAEA